MLNVVRGVLLALGVALAFLVTSPPAVSARQDKDKAIVCTFDSDADGWAVIGDAQEGKEHKPTYHAKKGNPGGHLSAKDEGTGGTWYWQAPAKFRGDRTSSYGKTLSFDLTQSKTDSQFDRADVVLVGPKTRLVFKLPKHPGTDWTHFEVPLSAGKGWRKENLKGAAATEKDIREVLGALGKLRIRGEYRDGNDTGRLDNVVLEK